VVQAFLYLPNINTLNMALNSTTPSTALPSRSRLQGMFDYRKLMVGVAVGAESKKALLEAREKGLQGGLALKLAEFASLVCSYKYLGTFLEWHY
jgi:hypothetical protein